jgi:two-component sensor histidine kinase
MSTNTHRTGNAGDVEVHLANIADNLQLIADLSYGDVALCVPGVGGVLSVVADMRPNTAVAPMPPFRVGRTLRHEDEPEAYEALGSGAIVTGTRTRVARGIKYTTTAFPIGGQTPYAVVIRNLAEQVAEAPGAMETAFMAAALDLLTILASGPMRDLRTGEPFSTVRTAGDGVLRVDLQGRVTYASPNAVNIMRLAGFEGPVRGTSASELPGGGFSISPALGTRKAAESEIEVAARTLRYRSLGFSDGALVLIQDITEARRREAEIKVKEATIREVHHRVKNNLQTISSLLRIQARRSGSDEVRHALAEAVERVSSMAVVHDLLAGSDEERVDFAEAARNVVDLVCRGLVGESTDVTVAVSGSSGQVDAPTATSLALAIAELVHNAIEHGIGDSGTGEVQVQLRRVPDELVIVVRDNGKGLPDGFDPVASANLGLEIVRTVVKDDLRGTMSFTGGRGTTVTVRVPVPDEL